MQETETQRLERVLRSIHARDYYALLHDPEDLRVFEKLYESVAAAAKSRLPIRWPDLKASGSLKVPEVLGRGRL